MASIKISALSPITDPDRLTPDDAFIVNDGSSSGAVTQRVSFDILKQGLDRQGHVFTGDVEFHGKVLVASDASDVAGTNIYTRTQTDNAISAAVTPIQTGLSAAESEIDNINAFLGPERLAGNLVLIGGSFKTGKMRAKNHHIESAVRTLDDVDDDQYTKIGANLTAINNNTARLDGLDAGDASLPPSDPINLNEGSVTTLIRDVQELKDVVYVSGVNQIEANGTLIESNADKITILSEQIGSNQASDGNIAGHFNGTDLDGNQNVINALLALTAKDTEILGTSVNGQVSVKGNRYDIASLQATTSGTQATVDDFINSIWGAFNSFSTVVAGDPTKNTALDLAQHIADAIDPNA